MSAGTSRAAINVYAAAWAAQLVEFYMHLVLLLMVADELHSACVLTKCEWGTHHSAALPATQIHFLSLVHSLCNMYNYSFSTARTCIINRLDDITGPCGPRGIQCNHG